MRFQLAQIVSQDTIFDPYNIHSAAENNAINLRVPLASLHRALRSAASASSASIRLTKKDDIPMLSLTIITSNLASRHPTALVSASLNQEMDGPRDEYGNDGNSAPGAGPDASMAPPGVAYDRETTITQDVPVIVLAPVTVALIHQPHCPEPDVHIILPPLLQLKSISERFTKLALSTSTSSGGATTSRPSTQRQRMASTLTGDSFGTSSSRLLISANMHGVLKLGLETSQLRIESQWTGLTNPDLDPTQVEGGEAGIQDHASTRMKQRYGDDAWSRVRVEGKDWGRVLGVGRMGGRVIACMLSPVHSSKTEGEDTLRTDSLFVRLLP